MKRQLTLLLTLSTGIFAQHSAHQGAGQVQPIVDGSKNPELIPDRTAINLFIIAVTEPPDATPEQLGRLKAKIRRMDLKERDIATFIGAVTGAHNQLMAIQKSAHQGAEVENHNMTTYSNILASRRSEPAKEQDEDEYAAADSPERARLRFLPPEGVPGVHNVVGANQI